jgi:outer membrane lipoprotein-sorting protein
MTNHDEQGARDFLEKALAALRDAPVPDGPPPDVAASTVRALQSTGKLPDVVRRSERRKKMLRIARYSGAAAAVTLLAVLACWLLLMDRTARPAFALVVEKVKHARSVTFLTKIEQAQGRTLQQRWYLRGDSFRMEIPNDQAVFKAPADAPPVLLALIGDAKQKKALQLDFARKTAHWIAGDEKAWQAMTKDLADPIAHMRRLKSQDAERLADEEWDGRKTQVYRLKNGDIFMGVRVGPADTAKLWVDPKSGLPVRIAVEHPLPDGNNRLVLAFERFTWNEALDPDLFRLEVPKGFSLEEKAP